MTTSLLAVTAAGLAFTALTLRAAWIDRRELVRAGKNGIRLAYARQTIRHESLRLAKHLLLVAVVVVTLLNVEHLLAWRNVAVFCVSGLLSLNSLLDLIDRRRDLASLRLRTTPAFAQYAKTPKP